MSRVGRAVGTVAGAVIGFALGGPAGALRGASLGYALTSRPSTPDYAVDTSPTYSLGPIQMTKSHQIPVPLVYGRNRVAGNIIYEDIYGSDDQYMDVQVGVAEGPVQAITDIKVNDIHLPGISYDLTATVGGVGYSRKHVELNIAGTVDWSCMLIGPIFDHFNLQGDSFFRVRSGRTSDDPAGQTTYVYQEHNGSGFEAFSGSFEVSEQDLGFITVELYIPPINYATLGGGLRMQSIPGSQGRVQLPHLDDAIRLGYRDQDLAEVDGSPIHDEHFSNTAYISAHLDAEELELRGAPTITSIVHGKQVRVYSYDEQDNLVYSVEYSRNPAWCLLDVLINDRYGVGMDISRIDIPSFIAAAEWYDEMVEGEPRFRFDQVFDVKRPATDVVRDILTQCQSFLIDMPGRLYLMPDTVVPEEEIAQHFDMDNIIEGSFSYQQTSKQDIPNRVVVEYIDPEDFETRQAVYSNDTDIRQRGEVIEHEVRAYGVQRFDQAARLARLFHNKAWYNRYQCQFSASIDSLHCLPGDVITISHDLPEWDGKKFRLLETREDEQDNMLLVCQEYNAAVYNDEGHVYQRPEPPAIPHPQQPPRDVQSFELTETGDTLGDGTYVPIIQVSWQRPEDPFWQAAHVYYMRTMDADGNVIPGADWQKSGVSENSPHEIKLAALGTYLVRVVSENRDGKRSNFGRAPSSEITVVGKLTRPPTPQFAEWEFISDIRLSWNPVLAGDLQGYEVRTDTNFGVNDGHLLYRDDGLSLRIADPTQREYTFYIKALNRSGLYSEEYDTVTVTNPPPAAPPMPEITEFFNGLWIDMKPVDDPTVQYYTLYVTPSDGDGNPTGETEVSRYSTAPRRVRYDVPSGASRLVQVAAGDIIGEGPKSEAVEGTAVFIAEEDIPDGMLEQSKLTETLSEKIDTSAARSEHYWDQELAMPTQEDYNEQTTDTYRLRYEFDIYVGTEDETDPNAIFFLSDQENAPLVDSGEELVTVTDVVDENGGSLLGDGSPRWYGDGSGEEVWLELSGVPTVQTIRVVYAVRSNLRELADNALIKRGVVAVEGADANVLAAIENIKGLPWDETLPEDQQIVSLHTRINNNQGDITTNSTAITSNADEINLVATQVGENEDEIVANQAAIGVNADNISLHASRLDAAEGEISANAASIDVNADNIQANVTSITEIDGELDTHESQINLLANEFTVKVQHNDRVTGFGLAIGEEESEFAIVADRFRLFSTEFDPEEEPKSVFTVDTQARKVYLLGDMIADGTITARMVTATEAIIAHKAQIGTATIDTAHIDEIQGHKIVGSTLQSTNWSSSNGSEFNLDNGQFRLGGSSDPNLGWDGNTLIVRGSIHVMGGNAATQEYAETTVSAHESDTGGVHGVPSGDAVESDSGAQSKADSAENSAVDAAETFTMDYAEKQVSKGTSPPSSPNTGDLWLYTGTSPNIWYRWSGSTWVKATPENADEIKETVSKKWAAESGADVTGDHTADDTAHVDGRDASDIEDKAGAQAKVDDHRDEKGEIHDYYVGSVSSDQHDEGDFSIILCRADVDGKSNHVAGTIYGRRVSGNTHTAKVDIVFNNASDGTRPSGTFEAITIQESKQLSLITCDYEGNRYLALRVNTHRHRIWSNGVWFSGQIASSGHILEIANTTTELSNISTHQSTHSESKDFGSVVAWPGGDSEDANEAHEHSHDPHAPEDADKTSDNYSQDQHDFDDGPQGNAGGGSVIINGNGVTATKANGDHSILDGELLKFFKSGYDIPHWYTKRVAYGIAEDGDYIDLEDETGVPWDHAPKVSVAIASLDSYDPDYSNFPQRYLATASTVTSSGFFVHGENVVGGAEHFYDYWSGTGWCNHERYLCSTGTLYTDPSWTSVDTASRLELRMRHRNNWYEPFSCRIQYRKSGGSWVTYTSYGGYTGTSWHPNAISSKTTSIHGLDPGTYQLRFVLDENGYYEDDHFGRLEGEHWMDWYRYFGDTLVASGSVLWIAVEGGAQ